MNDIPAIPAPPLLVVEDVHELREDFGAAHEVARRNREVIPRPEFISHRKALEPLEPPERGRRQVTRFSQYAWQGTETLIIDCLDRNLVVEPPPPSRSVLTFVEILAVLRRRQDAGRAIPRTLVYSRTLSISPLLRAVIREFTRPIVEEPGNDRVRRVRRLGEPSQVPGFEPTVAGMYDFADIRADLAGVVLGRVPSTVPELPDRSVVWEEIGPRSCLASFHEQMRVGRDRSMTDEEWSTWVLGPFPTTNPTKGFRRRVGDGGVEHLDVDPHERPRWHTFVHLLRDLARGA